MTDSTKKTTPDKDAPLGVREASRLTRIPPSTFARWRKNGLIEGDLTLAKIRAVKRQRNKTKVVNKPSLAEAARILGVTRQRVEQWQDKGHLPRPLTPEAVEQFKAARDTGGDPPSDVS